MQTTRTRILEAVLFASDSPVEFSRLLGIIESPSQRDLKDMVETLNREYETEGRTFRIMEVAGGYQFETLPQYGQYVERLYRSKGRQKLSRAALETLAIVAYKQPVSRVEIDALRGVDSDASVRTLQSRELIEVVGRSEALGKPLLYGTTKEFLRYFGLSDIKALPGADELASMFDGTESDTEIPGQLTLGGVIFTSSGRAEFTDSTSHTGAKET
jgi:segregation and condensation protein B